VSCFFYDFFSTSLKGEEKILKIKIKIEKNNLK